MLQRDPLDRGSATQYLRDWCSKVLPASICRCAAMRVTVSSLSFKGCWSVEFCLFSKLGLAWDAAVTADSSSSCGRCVFPLSVLLLHPAFQQPDTRVHTHTHTHTP
eukprot:4820154-Amphidinium_carterae.3